MNTVPEATLSWTGRTPCSSQEHRSPTGVSSANGSPSLTPTWSSHLQTKEERSRISAGSPLRPPHNIYFPLLEHQRALITQRAHISRLRILPAEYLRP